MAHGENIFGASMPEGRTNYAGMVHTQTFGGRDSFLKPRFLPEVLRRYPTGNVKLTAIIDSMMRKKTTSTDIGFTIENIRYPTLTLVSDMPPATSHQASTIEVDDVTSILPNMIFVLGAFGEQVMVTDIVGDHQVVVIRGMGTTRAFGAPAGTQMLFAGNAFEEGSLRPLGMMSGMEKLFTQTQIFRNGWATTETMHAVATAQGINVTSRSKADASYYHATDIESAVMFGQQSNMVIRGKPQRTFSGLVDVVRYNAPQNIINVDGDMNYDDLCSVFEMFGDVQIGENPSTSRIIYGDKTFVTAFHQLGMKYGHLMRMTTDSSDSFGQRFRQFVTPRMTFNVYEHPLFSIRRMPKGMAIVVDPSTMELHYLRDTRVSYFNATESGAYDSMSVDGGVDARGGDFLSELGFVCTNPAANGIVYGFTGAKCNASC